MSGEEPLGALRSEGNPIRVDWIDTAEVPAGARWTGRLGMTFLPGKRDRGMSGHHSRDLALDVGRLRPLEGVDAFVLLVEDHELEATGTTDIAAVMERHDIELTRLPIVDGDVPRDLEGFGALVAATIQRLRAGANVVVACHGGLGRTGMLVACLLVEAGLEAEAAAIALTRSVRSGAIETGGQEALVRAWRPVMAAKPLTRRERFTLDSWARAIRGILHDPETASRFGEGRFTWVARPDPSGRRYWVMRSDRGNGARLWAELVDGRLRQGWGWTDEQDLRLLQQVARSGSSWTEPQRAAARNRRMLSSEPNSIQIGDLVIVPHMPAEGRWSLVPVTGPYEYGSSDGWPDYRHILPVEVLFGGAGIDPNRPPVIRRLRASLRNQNRMWNIAPVGPDVELLVATIEVRRAPAT